MKRHTSTQRWFGPLLISALLILALLQLAACDTGNNVNNNGSSNSNSGNSNNNSNSMSTNSGSSNNNSNSSNSNNNSNSGSSNNNSGSSNNNSNSVSANSGGGGPSTSNDTWYVTINSVTSPASYNGYTPYAGNHFLIVDASFTNTSSGEQILGPSVFVVKDNQGQQYSEDQASNPGQTFTVEPNKTIETQTAYVVPDSECNFTLTFIGNSNSNGLQWTIAC